MSGISRFFIAELPKGRHLRVSLFLILSVILIFTVVERELENNRGSNFVRFDKIDLPEPITYGSVSIEEAISDRRSVRKFLRYPLNLNQISQILWSAQGISDTVRDLRTVPSAGALYPLEVYLFAGEVEGLNPGIYKYIPSDHGLLPVVRGDKRRELTRACLNQSFIENAPAVLLVTAVVQRTEARYGSRAERYVFIEAGHLGQNVSLEAVSLGLSSVMVGAFDDEKVILTLGGVQEEIPVYVIPFGYKSD